MELKALHFALDHPGSHCIKAFHQILILSPIKSGIHLLKAIRLSLTRIISLHWWLLRINIFNFVQADGTDSYIDYLETWKGMEDAKKQGLAKSIGVSNFNSQQIKRIIENSEIPPAVNQIEVS